MNFIGGFVCFHQYDSGTTGISANTWYRFYMKVEGTSVTGKIYDNNGNELHSNTQTLSSAQSYKKWNIVVGANSQTVKWKNLKIKPL